jgi:hypothetical protein
VIGVIICMVERYFELWQVKKNVPTWRGLRRSPDPWIGRDCIGVTSQSSICWRGFVAEPSNASTHPFSAVIDPWSEAASRSTWMHPAKSSVPS